MTKTILMIGLGKTGFSIARHLQATGQDFIAYDTRLEPADLKKFQELYPNIEVFCHDYPPQLLEKIDKIICSPGVALHEEILQEAMAKNIPIQNDLDCLMELIDAPVIGITGSNGKSTVTTLVGLMCQAQGLNTAIGGNLGTPVLDLYYANPHYDIWVLELSSFQLLHMQHLKLKAATILNVSPDHIDYHGSMDAYVSAKQRIYENTDMLIYNRDDELSAPKSRALHEESFGLSSPKKNQWGILNTEHGQVIAFEDSVYLSVNELKIKGRHNWLNAMAASALAKYVGVSDVAIKQVLKDFPGLEHRTQWVSHRQGITFINDSKGTNLGATYAAIEGLGPTLNHGKIVLIAGGQGKGADFTPMRTLLEKYVRYVVLIGQDAKLLEQQWQNTVEMQCAATLLEAVNMANEKAQAGDIVLLSPACASLDMFKNYEDRGQQFEKLVKGLK
jgi:UDP-N-acetylmuramoylalanine--D-glutamate ligase